VFDSTKTATRDRPSKSRAVKIRGMKMRDEIAGPENAGHRQI